MQVHTSPARSTPVFDDSSPNIKYILICDRVHSFLKNLLLSKSTLVSNFENIRDSALEVSMRVNQ